MSDSNAQDNLNTELGRHAKTNEERILALEIGVNGRGGLYVMVEKLTAKIDELSGKIDSLDDKIDGVDNRLKNMEQCAKDAKEARKPIIGEVIGVIGSLVLAAIVGLVTWLLTSGGVR